MKDDPVWVERELVDELHSEQLEKHGGADGVRDVGLLDSAMNRPRQLFAYADPTPDIPTLAACYAYGIARNHAFVDGNKRTAFFVASDFLDQNGYELQAAVDQEHADMMVELAQGKMTRADAAAHLRTYSIKTSAT